MNSFLKSIAFTSIAAVSVATIGSVAQARAIGGFGGHADDASQASAFVENWNGVLNNGSGSYRWDVPLVVDPAGNYTPTVAVYVNGASSNVSCTTQAVTNTGSDYSNTGWYSTTQGNTNGYITPGTVTVPNGGSLEVACFLSPGSKLIDVVW
jgi:hypothetical protein